MQKIFKDFFEMNGYSFDWVKFNEMQEKAEKREEKVKEHIKEV